jgi:hypothetical protein
MAETSPEYAGHGRTEIHYADILGESAEMPIAFKSGFYMAIS